MIELLETFQSPWAMRALLASSMVGIMCGALGAFIVLRNMSLIGDALAHAILPGIVISFMLFGHHSLGFFVGAVIAGLVTAVAITWIQQKVKTKNDAAIGIVFTAMFAMGVIGISRLSKQDGVHLDLKDFLFGNVLGVSDVDLQLTAIVTIVVLACIVIFYRYLFVTTFQPVVASVMGIKVNAIHYLLMLLLSFAVVASLRTVGVILVVAMLITPASTALLLSNRLKVVIALSALIGLLSAILGLIISIQWETTPGPAMAVTVTGFYLLAVFFSPQKGLLFKSIRKRKFTKKIELEDLLKRTFHLQNRSNNSLAELAKQLTWPLSKVKSVAQQLSQKSLGMLKNDQVILNSKGTDEALRLIRAHRLWESYLVKDMGLNDSQIHDDAERFEHVLTDDQVNRLDQHLGFPSKDPHGAPIPGERKSKYTFLDTINPETEVVIASRQRNTYVTNNLWKMGLTPGEKIQVIDRLDGRTSIISAEGDRYEIDEDLGKQIQVERTVIAP